LLVLKRALVGRPLATAQEHAQKLPKKLALPIFSSDAISSNAYATEEILLVLVTAGAVGLRLLVPITLAVALLLVVVSLSYRQTVYASTEIPTRKAPRMKAMMPSVVDAFLLSGDLKTGTPFEMASTPVIATHPPEKAFSTRKMVRSKVASCDPAAAAGGRSPRSHRPNPTTINPPQRAMKE
jgi:hypothetical protein